ncbi:hypothetical protein QRD02_14070 [Aequorivita sp. SDUM287046]|uniref:DKNYY family protein n=1 Tax=Aequorivita aurantiaca TaxID=3053356 RepID=A0ABT8DR19_9FLAO|nr:hypothetical protein [Aequorivita aurantiaca]MDN3725512.1 hypothetical protein [Aequorivita aurantiaca]
MMKNLFIIFTLTFTFIACKDNPSDSKQNEENEYYENNPKVVFKRTVHKTDFDSVYYFYDDGTLFKKGKQYKENQKFGIWELYDRESKLREIREWFTIEGESRANRVWHLNKKGDTIAWREEDSIYKQKRFFNDTIYFRNTSYDYIWFNKDTIQLKEPLKATVEIWSPSIRNYPANTRVLLSRQENNFNYDYSNEKEIKLDTFYDLTTDTENQKWFPDSDFNHIVVFGRWFDNPGEKIIRGYYQQYYNGPFDSRKDGKRTDSIIGYKTYFEKRIFVMDSI